MDSFVEKLLIRQKDIDPEFVDVVNKHFWELIDNNMTKGEKIIRTDYNKENPLPTDVFKIQIAEMIDGLEHYNNKFKDKD